MKRLLLLPIFIASILNAVDSASLTNQQELNVSIDYQENIEKLYTQFNELEELSRKQIAQIKEVILKLPAHANPLIVVVKARGIVNQIVRTESRFKELLIEVKNIPIETIPKNHLIGLIEAEIKKVNIFNVIRQNML